jgi:hypothetical protein
MPWSTAVDVFAFACTIAELYLGRQLFLTSIDTVEQMEMVERVMGKIPAAFVQRTFKQGRSVFSKQDHMVNKNSASPSLQSQKVQQMSVRRHPFCQGSLADHIYRASFGAQTFRICCAFAYMATMIDVSQPTKPSNIVTSMAGAEAGVAVPICSRSLYMLLRFSCVLILVR